MIVEVRYIERTPLKLEPYVKFIKKYVTTKRPIVIVFDRRFTKDFGNYTFDGKKHVIRISTLLIQLYEYITTTLHELKHLQQWQIEKSAFWAESRVLRKEAEAREYEMKHVFFALDYYEEMAKHA